MSLISERRLARAAPRSRAGARRRPGDAGVTMLVDAGVVLIVVAPGAVCIAGFSRNVERASQTLTGAGARLLVAHGSEWLDVAPTAGFLRREGRTSWGTAFGRVDIDLEPLLGVDYGALLVNSDPVELDDPGPPWAGAAHREAIAMTRAHGGARAARLR